MKRSFGDRSHSGKIVNFYKGGIQIFAGVFICSLLLTGNVLSLLAPSLLKKTDISNQPPTSHFLQKLLYSPENPISEEHQQYQDWDFDFSNENSSISFRIENAPEGMTINPETGVVEWCPKENQYGKYNLSIISINSDNSQGQLEFVSTPVYTAVVNKKYVYKPKIVSKKSSKVTTATKQSFTLYVSKHAHFFGTNPMGYDMLACIVYGTKWTLIPGFIAISVALLLGILLGGFSGYYEGNVNSILSIMTNIFAAFPSLLLIFLAAAIFNFNIYLIMIVFGLVLFPKIAIQIQNKVKQLKNRQFIEAAKELGLTDAKILWIDIIWMNGRALLLTTISYGFAAAILLEVTLSYLRLGIQDSSFSWGNLLYSGRYRMDYNEFWMLFFPALAIVLSILGFYLLGDGMNRKYSIKEM